MPAGGGIASGLTTMSLREPMTTPFPKVQKWIICFTLSLSCPAGPRRAPSQPARSLSGGQTPIPPDRDAGTPLPRPHRAWPACFIGQSIVWERLRDILLTVFFSGNSDDQFRAKTAASPRSKRERIKGIAKTKRLYEGQQDRGHAWHAQRHPQAARPPASR